MPKIFYWSFIIFIFLSNFKPTFANEPLKPLKSNTPPIIDGKLNDPTWQQAPSVSGFKTFSPDYGLDGSEKTIAYMAYDSENLYFAFYCFDKETAKIKTSVTSRDRINSDDWVCINLDSFNDQQSLFAFYVNPAGIQMDSRFAAGIEDISADFIWYSAGQMVDNGYTIEICIPLKSVRFSENNPVTMSVFFERYISRYSEHDSYPELDPAKGYNFLNQMQTMIYYDLKNFTLFELLPAFTYGQKYKLETGKIVIDEHQKDFSLTTKYGITSDLILDGTYNPDFSQVEADAGQVDVNLRYSLYYPEKRPFFLEGNENFRIAATTLSEVDPIKSLVHTRNIINPLAGIRLNGKIGTKNTLAVMYAMDELPADETAQKGNYSHFPIFRYKRSLSEDSYLGALYTGNEYKDHYNHVVGVDGIIRLSGSGVIEFNGLLSRSKINAASNKMDGNTFGVRYYSTSRDVDCDFGIKEVSENFNVETGYITRTGIIGINGLYRPKFYPESDFFQRTDVELFSAQTQDRSSTLWETFNHISLQSFFAGSLTVKVKYSYSTEVYSGDRFKTGGFHILAGGQFSKLFNLSILYRRINAIYYSNTPFQGESNSFTASLIYHPTENLETEVDFIFHDFSRESDSKMIYEYPILHGRLTYQLNRYFFIRGVLEYNKFKRQLLTDFLASFTYIPGTVIHIGYGALYQRIKWQSNQYVNSDSFMETQRGLFFKMSYLWRL